MSKFIQVAIDSPAAAGAGTQAKLIANHYNLFYLDTGKIYRFIGNLKIQYKKKFKGSILDGRDITSVIMKKAMFKFYITANVQTRALRRYKELRSLNKKITYQEVIKSIKIRDKSDYNRKISPLKKTKDSILINTSNLTKRSCFLKIKKIMDKKLKY